jgi:hypothetical protein
LVIASGMVVFLAVELGRYFFPSWAMSQIAGWVLTGGALIGILYMVSLLCAWAFRARWAGSLVHSIRTLTRPLWFYPVLLVMNSWNIIRSLQRGLHTADRDAIDVYLGASMLTLIFVISIYSMIVLPFLEVRDRGLLHRGRLISWLNIESYEWESSAEPGELVVFSMRPAKAVLRLHVSRLFSILPPPRIRVPQEHQEELEAILKRHLSDWPQS